MRHFQPSTFPPPLFSQDIVHVRGLPFQMARKPVGYRELQQSQAKAQNCSLLCPAWKPNTASGLVRFPQHIRIPSWAPAAQEHSALTILSSLHSFFPTTGIGLGSEQVLSVWKIQTCSKIVVLLVEIKHRHHREGLALPLPLQTSQHWECHS